MAEKKGSAHIFEVSTKEGVIDTEVVSEVSKAVKDRTKNTELAVQMQKVLEELKRTKDIECGKFINAGDSHFRCEIANSHDGKIGLYISDRTEDREKELGLEEQVRILQKNQLLSENLGMICHDILNIDTSILGELHIFALNRDLTDFERQKMKRITEACERRAKLTKRLLNLNRSSDYAMRTVDVVESLDSAIYMLGTKYVREGILVEEKYEKDLPEAVGNAELLYSVWLNLMKNAYDAIMEKGQKGKIIISAETYAKDTGKVRISFSDDGIGMDDEKIQQWRSTESRHFGSGKKDGHGYGMMIVKNVIKKHGASYSVKSTPGQGTTFSVYLKKAKL
jgi:signal transduction histidine kinase